MEILAAAPELANHGLIRPKDVVAEIEKYAQEIETAWCTKALLLRREV